MNCLMVGTGNISRTWLAAAEKVGVAIVACVSRSGSTPEGSANMPVFSSITEAAAALSFDAVLIVTPNGLHHESAIEAAKLGKHVLTEKPLDISRQSMAAMIEAADNGGITLAVSYQRRTNPDNLALKALFDKGSFGRIYAADLSCKFWRDDAYYASAPYRGSIGIDGGGPFMQQACHNIDLYQWFFGMPVEVKSMLATMAHSIEAEDHGAALLRYESGMIGTIIASTLAKPGLPARLEVHTQRGYFVTLDDRITEWHIEGIDNPAAPSDGFVQAGSSSHVVADTSRHEAILRDFMEALRDRREPLVTARSARDTTELILRIYGQF